MKPIRAFLALVLLLSLLAGYIVAGALLIAEAIDGRFEEASTILSSLVTGRITDYKPYVSTTFNYFIDLASQSGNTPLLPTLIDHNGIYYRDYEYLDREVASKNIIIFYNPEIDVNGPPSEDYPYGFLFKNGQLHLWTDSLEGGSVDSAGYFYRSFYYRNNLDTWLPNALEEDTVGMFFAEEPLELSSLYSPLCTAHNEFTWMRLLVLGFLLSFALTLFLFCYVILNRRSLAYAAERIARLLGYLPIEIKLVFALFAVAFDIMLLEEGYRWEAIYLILAGYLIFFELFLLISDLADNRARFFTNNLAGHAIKALRKLLSLKPFGRAELISYIVFVSLEGLLSVIAVWFLLIGMLDGWAIFFFLFFLLLILAAAVLFGIHLCKRNREIECLLSRIDHMKRGEPDAPCNLPESSHFIEPMAALDNIYSHVKSATEQSLKSERMKLELITNVSHDLKTPLTSIISYVDLLSKEENLSPTARDYIGILEKKSARLKVLIGDLFDLSKAASANIAYHPEPLDLVRLVNQVHAELADKIEESELRFIYRAPDEPQIITSDGMLLRRVIENLTVNALKYALPHSRVYIDIIPEDTAVRYTIKNTSREELLCTPDELTARFVRGDNSRTTEGSGLGLSIAQSYTEVCGGSFDLTLDGDLFKVTLTFTKSGSLPVPTMPVVSEDIDVSAKEKISPEI